MVACLVSFDLVERQFNFPALVVGGGEVECGGELVVGDRGDEAEQFPTAGSVGDHVLDHPDEGGLGGLEICTGLGGGDEHVAAAAADLRVNQHGSVGAIRQGGQDRQRQPPRDPPQQRRSGRAGLLPGLITVEIAIGQDEHADSEPG